MGCAQASDGSQPKVIYDHNGDIVREKPGISLSANSNPYGQPQYGGGMQNPNNGYSMAPQNSYGNPQQGYNMNGGYGMPQQPMYQPPPQPQVISSGGGFSLGGGNAVLNPGVSQVSTNQQVIHSNNGYGQYVNEGMYEGGGGFDM